jgi:uncharacterized membrane protein YtjA (UPF0391 family)
LPGQSHARSYDAADRAFVVLAVALVAFLGYAGIARDASWVVKGFFVLSLALFLVWALPGRERT